MVLKRVFLATFEAWAIATLLRSALFHRAVHRIVRGVHRIRHGTPLEDMGGTSIDRPATTVTSFFKHFKDELKAQAGMSGRKDGK